MRPGVKHRPDAETNIVTPASTLSTLATKLLRSLTGALTITRVLRHFTRLVRHPLPLGAAHEVLDPVQQASHHDLLWSMRQQTYPAMRPPNLGDMAVVPIGRRRTCCTWRPTDPLPTDLPGPGIRLTSTGPSARSAIDALGMPAILDTHAAITTCDPITVDPLTVTVAIGQAGVWTSGPSSSGHKGPHRNRGACGSVGRRPRSGERWVSCWHDYGLDLGVHTEITGWLVGLVEANLRASPRLT